ncbi:MAG: glycyl-radical enzyme activating protein [Lachnospiraceae bacterium]|nr:glycyl-radical enzyme activating protein [Lachnospiraceae bacterium]
MYVTADISNISRCSVHDGPGLRTVIYFKGCGLRCRWCHNPETFSIGRDIMYIPSKCIHCGRCVEVCPEHHVIMENAVVFKRNGCIKCGKCADVCPTGALVSCGEKMTIEQIMTEIVKDKHYFGVSHGGVTLSGGECLLQADFVAELLACCKKEDIHTVIETALFVSWANVEKVLPYTDMFFVDVKIAEPEKHRIYTGQDNYLIQQNLRRLTDTGAMITVRIPLIPGVNDSLEDMDLFGNILRNLKISGVELLRYNYMAESKYQSVGMQYEAFGTQAQTEDVMSLLCSRLQKHLKCRVFYK